ncbi:MAG: phospholipase D-like domain-containing protein [Halorubrum sp.]
MQRGSDRFVGLATTVSVPALGSIAALAFVVALALVPLTATAAPAATGSELVTTAAPSATTDDAPNASATESDLGPAIVELYPNPVTQGNRGEYLVVQLPSAGNWSLSDGHHTTSIPPDANGTVALSMEPALAADHLARAGDDKRTGVPTQALPSYFPLAAAGDRIELRRDDETVDAVAYGRVREGYRWRATWEEWRPDGYEPRAPERIAGATVTPFVLPDSPDVPIESFDAATDRILLAGYTVESDRVVDRLVAAHERGVTVRVLIEGTPVGGFQRRGAHAADRLARAGIDVRVLDGDPDRFRFHHAKYAVVDDRAVVLTENWKRSGTGGGSNRGWGVVADDSAVAAALRALFENDVSAADARTWRSFRANATVHGPPAAVAPDSPSLGRSVLADRSAPVYPARFTPPSAAPADVELLTAPGNAADRIVARIDAADDRVLAVVPRTGGPDERIVRALRRAADRNVDVHLLLSGEWYDREENRELAASLADEPIAVAVADPRGRYGKIHAKGLVIDDTAVVGSLNWNEQAATENREVLLAVDDPGVADFYARAYAADWRGGGVQLPLGLLGGLVASLAGAGLVARREVAFA